MRRFIYLILLLLSSNVFAETSTKAGGTFVNDTGVGTQAWSNPGNAVSSNDIWAEAANDVTEISNYLKITNFGFALPASIIEGIRVDIERSATGAGDSEDYRIRLVKDGTIQTTDKAVAGIWPGTDAVASYGGTNDLWSGTWTKDDINNSGFGIAISCEETEGKSDADTCRVDYVTITVTFTNENVILKNALIKNALIQ